MFEQALKKDRNKAIIRPDIIATSIPVAVPAKTTISPMVYNTSRTNAFFAITRHDMRRLNVMIAAMVVSTAAMIMKNKDIVNPPWC